MNLAQRFSGVTRSLLAIGIALTATVAQAHEVGWRSLQLPAGGALDEPATVALYYPTEAAPRTVPMGAFRVEGTIGAPPVDRYRGLLLFSHGMGGTEIGQGRIAEGLARRGWLVAVMRHPHDNWQDPSLIREGPYRYFGQRPLQASAVIDRLLADPQIASRIPSDERGPRIGALGHSAGGYTVLALAGGRLEVARLMQHCATQRADDPVFCGSGGNSRMVADPTAEGSRRDPRVRAIAALAPAGVPLSDESLAAISIPVTVWAGARDTFLVPRFHGERVARAIPGAQWHPVQQAAHFAFMDSPSMPIPSPDGNLQFDPPGFDRAAFLERMGGELDTFFAESLERSTPR